MRINVGAAGVMVGMLMSVASGVCAANPPEIRTVKVVTHQSLDKGETRLPLESAMSKILMTGPGLEVVEDGPHDALIEIWVKGRCRSAKYGEFKIGKENPMYFTGGKIEGTIRLSSDHLAPGAWTFEGEVSPPKAVDPEKLGRCRKPNAETLMKVLGTSRFPSLMWVVLESIVGTDVLKEQVRKNIERNRSGDGAIVSGRISALGLLDDVQADHLLIELLAVDMPNKARTSAAIGLGYSKNREAFEPLLEIFKSESKGTGSSLGRAAQWALEQITGIRRPSEKALRKWQEKNS